MDDAPPLGTVARTFEVVDALQGSEGATPAELAEELDIPRSTAHDYLRSLEWTGFVVGENGRYRTSFAFLSVGGRRRNQNRFYRAAEPETERLAEETGELPSIAVEENGECVILHTRKGEQSLDLGMYPGLRTPIHSHATGKALLAHLGDDRIEELLAGDLEQRTEHTVTDPDVLREELAEVRERGYAADWDQQVVGMGTIAVPIIVEGDLVGAVSLSGPTGRVSDDDYRDELLKKLREAANTITVSYQYGR
jgi:DNA-binding IclR family transcriptional regulator